MATGGNILALTQHPTGSNATGAAVSVTVAKPSGISILIASCRFTGGTATSVAITDNGANAGWNSLLQSLGVSYSLSVWWRLATPTDIANLTKVTFTPTGGTLTAAAAKVDEFTGNPATVAVDFQEGATTWASAATVSMSSSGAPGQTSGSVVELVYAVGAWNAAHTATTAVALDFTMRGVTLIDATNALLGAAWGYSIAPMTSTSGIKFSWTTNSAGRPCFVVFSMPASAMPALLSV